MLSLPRCEVLIYCEERISPQPSSPNLPLIKLWRWRAHNTFSPWPSHLEEEVRWAFGKRNLHSFQRLSREGLEAWRGGRTSHWCFELPHFAGAANPSAKLFNKRCPKATVGTHFKSSSANNNRSVQFVPSKRTISLANKQCDGLLLTCYLKKNTK